MVAPCVFRDLADEAYRIDAGDGIDQRVEMWLCNWPTTMGPRPPWVARLIGSGLAIKPVIDCQNCSVRKPL